MSTFTEKAPEQELILILDFGSQYTQLIARRIRELGVYSEIRSYNTPLEEIVRLNPKGVVLSGGPSSVYAGNAPLISPDIFKLSIPILGICYGLQLITHLLGGKVGKADHREYGYAELNRLADDALFSGIDPSTAVWMSHGDKLTVMPDDFTILARTKNSPYCVIKHQELPIYGIQFHPEVAHTKQGNIFLKNFIFDICACHGLWTSRSFIEHTVQSIREQVGDEKVLCAVSGGVDSSVAARLMYKAIGKQLITIFVDNGLLRENEGEEVREMARAHFPENFQYVDAGPRFLEKLREVTDPERKRKIIGETFIRVFEDAAKKAGDIKYLVQGTLYPDVIESVSTKGPSAVIKTHHNVGGLPEDMDLEIIEPLRELFKDEVRNVGKELGLPDHVVGRHPFPGPGLAVRLLGNITEDRLRVLRKADKIFIDELHRTDHYNRTWQAFAVLLPINSVGVMGDERTYENVIALRAVTSRDAMTADWAKLPHSLLDTVANRITNEVKGVNRVVYDISSKPPSTIEWE
ncbi:MAG: glutamine-hydrolyzing GMP synthase [candidate division KSB1 bacterium]|jgi:GMP synthase (glutamine-hydrolysing)|nr:glutamine-hydrolyzing GMP synthase [candidate division KSB1 bacterium]